MDTKVCSQCDQHFGREKVKKHWDNRKYETKAESFSGGTWGKFRDLALERDDWTCQVCGLQDSEIMTVDHIIPKSDQPELMYVMENLKSLCPNCHARKNIADRKKKYLTELRVA